MHLILALALLLALPIRGYEVAPRITDREIVETLTELRAGQQALRQQIVDVHRRIDDHDVGSVFNFDRYDGGIFRV